MRWKSIVNPPLIGITTDSSPRDPTFAMEGFTVESELYRAIVNGGGLPVALPSFDDALPPFFSRLSGVVFSGGGYAVPDDWYSPADARSPYDSSPRFEYSLLLLSAALQKSLPVLGICAGMQLIAGAHGARLTALVSDDDSDPMSHWQVEEQATAVHEVTVREGSLLASLVGAGKLGVNSIHQEAVVESSDKLLISAVSADGVIEACEVPSAPFCLGLQWHPEQMREEEERHLTILRGFLSAARSYSERSVSV